MKQNFFLVVDGAHTTDEAERAVLSAFASRDPDGLKFDLMPYEIEGPEEPLTKEQQEAWSNCPPSTRDVDIFKAGWDAAVKHMEEP